MFRLTDEQRMLVDTTRLFLDRTGRGDAGDDAYWRQGADLGWAALLADDTSPQRFAGLALLAREFGRAVASGPIGPVNVVVGALKRGAAADIGGVTDRLVAGEAAAT